MPQTSSGRSMKSSKAKPSISRRTRPQGTRAKSGTDALSLLKADHREVEALFGQFEKMKGRESRKKEEIARHICTMLIAHATIEEEIFYPAVRDAIEGADLIDEAEVEHMSCKQLIADIEEMNLSDELFDAKVKVLGEYIKHHVKEEEGEIFKAVKKSDLDLQELGAEMAQRKEELMGDSNSAGERQQSRPSQQSGMSRM